ncbi:DUF721 domain-containing protein [Streptomyces sp. SAJ15]|uniref:DUF721 domain-containing protein n=1 Tax=Streptomyces sp. SAJ15 TaxID=2011095 RepID=UPI0021B27EA4|nr:DUF721 domain-containing protein [Streptomyces sp. SAJ15]
MAFHPETGQLDLRPDSPAYATQLRLITTRLIAAANENVGANAVHTIRVLPIGATTPAPRTEDTVMAAATAPQAPVRTREMASAGYHQALAAHLAAKPVHQVDPAIAAAVERQTKALLRQREEAFAEDQNALTQLNEHARRQASPADVSRAQALKRLADERAGRIPPGPKPLGRTA